jgi:hypothetical protein
VPKEHLRTHAGANVLVVPAHVPRSHRYLLVLENGTPANPPAFVTDHAEWREGDSFAIPDGTSFEIRAATRIGHDQIADLFDAIWVVRPADGAAAVPDAPRTSADAARRDDQAVNSMPRGD